MRGRSMRVRDCIRVREGRRGGLMDRTRDGMMMRIWRIRLGRGQRVQRRIRLGVGRGGLRLRRGGRGMVGRVLLREVGEVCLMKTFNVVGGRSEGGLAGGLIVRWDERIYFYI